MLHCERARARGVNGYFSAVFEQQLTLAKRAIVKTFSTATTTQLLTAQKLLKNKPSLPAQELLGHSEATLFEWLKVNVLGCRSDIDQGRQRQEKEKSNLHFEQSLLLLLLCVKH